jgi:hypothetical protein
MQMCLCAHDYPVLPNRRKENFCHSTRPWECLDLRIQSSMVILLSSCHFRRLVFSLQPLLPLNMLKHYDILGIDIPVVVTSTSNHELIPHGLAHNALKI